MLIATCPACGGHIANITEPKFRDGRRTHPLTCLNEHCPRPIAALEILSERETEHILVLEHGSFSLRHPLIERLPRPGETEPALLSCSVASYVAEFGQLMTRGDMGDWRDGVRYRVWGDGDGEDWSLQGEPLDSPG